MSVDIVQKVHVDLLSIKILKTCDTRLPATVY